MPSYPKASCKQSKVDLQHDPIKQDNSKGIQKPKHKKLTASRFLKYVLKKEGLNLSNVSKEFNSLLREFMESESSLLEVNCTKDIDDIFDQYLIEKPDTSTLVKYVYFPIIKEKLIKYI